ncbi:MAG: hypothetical protein O6940_13705, partial [Ignavibacteria bacterium]|nr:hypothetical protein [Ignavibacteria bacterium]
MRTLSKTFLIFIFCFITASNATNYYVDKDAIGSNNGSSWTNAWESFADINWAVLEAGDTLYISGGTISTTYNETLKPNTTNGEVGSRITITKGIDAGHDGEVIIDGQDIRANGIDSRKANNDYITFSRLTIKQSTTYEIRVEDAVGVIV